MDYKTVVIAVMAVIVVLLAGVNAIFLISPSEDMNNSSLTLGNNTTTNTSYSVNNSNSTEEPTHKVVYTKTNSTSHNTTKHNNTGGKTNTTKPNSTKTST
jgi:fibronectin type 3 domain-containing protein